MIVSASLRKTSTTNVQKNINPGSQNPLSLATQVPSRECDVVAQAIVLDTPVLKKTVAYGVATSWLICFILDASK